MTTPVDMKVESAGKGMMPSKAGEDIKEVWPGAMKFANERGHFFGCKVETMPAIELNTWAEQHPNHLIVEIFSLGRSTLGVERVGVVWTKTVSDAELEEMSAIQREAEEIHSKKKAERAKLQEEAEVKGAEEQKARAAKAAADLDELQRLANLARKAAKRDELLKLARMQGDLLADISRALMGEAAVDREELRSKIEGLKSLQLVTDPKTGSDA